MMPRSTSTTQSALITSKHIFIFFIDVYKNRYIRDSSENVTMGGGVPAGVGGGLERRECNY